MLFGIRGIEESTVYQGILKKGKNLGREEGINEGAIQEARKTLLRQGSKKLGAPNERIEAEITALDDLDRLDELIDRVQEVSSWDDLFSPSNSPR